MCIYVYIHIYMYIYIYIYIFTYIYLQDLFEGSNLLCICQRSSRIGFKTLCLCFPHVFHDSAVVSSTYPSSSTQFDLKMKHP